MLIRLKASTHCFVVTVVLYTGPSWAEEPIPETNHLVTQEVEKSQEVGLENFGEIAAQVGAFTGLRLKALLTLNRSHKLAIEGMYGRILPFPGTALFPTAFGGGIRIENSLSTGKKHAWMIAPGLNGYYIPADPYIKPEKPYFFDFNPIFSDIPTAVVMVSPNLDFSWVYQFERHLSIVTGAKVGALITINGVDGKGASLAGEIEPDLGLYVGTRF